MALNNHRGDAGGHLHPQLIERNCEASHTENYKALSGWRQTAMRVGLVLSFLFAVVFVPVAAQDAVPVVVDAFGEEVEIADASRIITIDGSITEIVFALGAQDQVVARDDSSLYPPAALALDSVGYVRRLSAEPVLALDPTLIITTESIGPVEAVDQLKESGVTFLILPSAESIEGIISNIQTIATALGREAEAVAVIERIETDFAAAQSLLETVESAPRVMFIYARGAGAISVAGTDTSAAAMIELVGAENAVTEFSGYQPITAESVVTAAPDVILLMTAGLDSIGGVDGLLEQPGIAQTPAGENRRVVAMEDLYLLGFSTRIGTAVLDLTYLIHEELEPSIITLLRADGDFNTLLRAFEIGGQTALLSGDSEYTLFAPTDEAIANTFPPEVLEGFFSSSISVQATFSYHLLEGVQNSEALAALAGGDPVQTLYSNGALAVSLNEDGGLVLNDSVNVTEADIVAGNGVIHVIDGVLVPARP